MENRQIVLTRRQFLKLLGIAAPSEMQGASLLPLLEGRRWHDHEGIFSQQRGASAQSVRTPDWRLILQLADSKTWPLYPQQAGQLELYDLEDDPQEKNNLWPVSFRASQEAQESLTGLLSTWNEITPLAEGMEVPLLDPEVEKMLRYLGY
jgi:hypothetical protein